MVSREKARALDPEKSAQQALQTLTFCAYVWFGSQTRPFTVFLNWNVLVGTWDFTFLIGHFWIVKPVPNQNPVHFLVVGTWVGGVRDPIQENWIGHFFGTPGGDGHK
jgi:hypothetical protein